MVFLRTGDLTEVPVPTRFIFILLGPQGNQGSIPRDRQIHRYTHVRRGKHALFPVVPLVEGVNNKLEAYMVVFANETITVKL